MTENKVEVTCPDCGHNEADFMAVITISNFDKEKNKDVITHHNHYKCLKCKSSFDKPRTDSNKHEEFMPK